MATKQQHKVEAASAEEGRHQAESHIGSRVLQTLGQPPGLHRVQVRRVGEESFRVNVFVGPDAVGARIAHSYFLIADGDGNIKESTPTITRHY